MLLLRFDSRKAQESVVSRTWSPQNSKVRSEMIGEYHDLFAPKDTDEPYPPEEVGIINVLRITGPGVNDIVPDSQPYRGDQIPNIEAMGQLFGAGTYKLIARRANKGKDGEPAGSVWKNRIITVGQEYGAPKRMIPPSPPTYAAAPNAVHPTPPPGTGFMPTDSMSVFMWMQHQSAERDQRMADRVAEQAREDRKLEREREDREREREERRAEREREERKHERELAREERQREAERERERIAESAKREREHTELLLKLQQNGHSAAPAAGLTGFLESVEKVADVAKKIRPSDDVEIAKVTFSGLAGLASIFGGGGGGIPGGGPPP